MPYLLNASTYTKVFKLWVDDESYLAVKMMIPSKEMREHISDLIGRLNLVGNAPFPCAYRFAQLIFRQVENEAAQNKNPAIANGVVAQCCFAGGLIRNHTSCPAFPLKSLVWLSVLWLNLRLPGISINSIQLKC